MIASGALLVERSRNNPTAPSFPLEMVQLLLTSYANASPEPNQARSLNKVHRLSWLVTA